MLQNGEYLTGYLELCDYLNVTRPTARQLVKDGQIPFLKFGGRYFFDKAKVEQAILKGGQDA